MGKSQKKRAIRRHNPIRVPDSHLSHGLEIASSTSSKTEAILPIIHKLGSADTADRTWACVSVSNIIQNDPSTRRLLQGKNIVGALITRLTDAAEEVMVEAAGALRNLCIDGGYDICAEMYNKNIMAPLRTFPAKISLILQQFLENPRGLSDISHRLVCEFAENIITIFWCLSETSNKALQAVNESKLTPFLMAFLQTRDRLPSSTVNAAAQCLYVLTEDNEPIIHDLHTESSFVACLLEIAQDQTEKVEPLEKGNEDTRSITLRVLVAGILRNISPLPAVIPASLFDLEHQIILPLLVPQLSIDLSVISATVTQILSTTVEVDTIQALDHAPQSDHQTSSEKELEHIEEKMRLTQLSLEILAGICAKIPEKEPISKEGTDDGLESNFEVNMEQIDGLIRRPVENGTVSSVLEASLDRALLDTNSLLSSLTTPLIILVHPTSLSFPPSPTEPSPHPPTTSALATIHIRALECLNNMFLASRYSMADPILQLSSGDVEGVRHVWNELWQAMNQVGKVVDNNTLVSRSSERIGMWEIAVGVMWGIAKFGRGYLVPDPEQVQTLMEFCEVTPDDFIKVKCVGALECLAQCQETTDANQIISSYLLHHISSPSPACVESCIQCASALIDIYSDESSPYDINFCQGNMLDELARVLPLLRKTVRSIDRRKPGGRELRERGDEVLENLTAFIKYRRELNV